MIARGEYSVRTRVIDDDGEVYAGEHITSACDALGTTDTDVILFSDWEWSFKLSKEW